MKLTQNILVPTDFSKAAEMAVDAAAILAKQNDAKVTLVHVIDPTVLAPIPTKPVPSSEQLKLEPETEQRIYELLHRIREEKLKDVPAVKTAVVLNRNAAQGIVHFATKENVDLIVITTHGRTGIQHLLIGSVAEKVVRHAPCPVLTLRSRAVETEA